MAITSHACRFGIRVSCLGLERRDGHIHRQRHDRLDNAGRRRERRLPLQPQNASDEHGLDLLRQPASLELQLGDDRLRVGAVLVTAALCLTLAWRPLLSITVDADMAAVEGVPVGPLRMMLTFDHALEAAHALISAAARLHRGGAQP